MTHSISIPNDSMEALHELSKLIDSFIDLICEENALLARGLPSGTPAIAARKNALADALEVWAKAATSRAVRLDDFNDGNRQDFLTRLAFFQRVMDENMRRLEAAMEASRKRIEAVMAAVREEMAKSSSYGADGKASQTPHQTSLGVGVRI